MSFQYVWDNDKAEKNLSKHKVSFEEAQTVFDDPLSYTFDDPDHSISEKMKITIGLSIKNRLLLVFSTIRHSKIRIFSSRLATKMEKKQYEESIK
jgi:hypothetical protein